MTSNTVATIDPTEIDLPDRTRIEMIDLLNRRLAESLDLGLQARHAHWNVRGPQSSTICSDACMRTWTAMRICWPSAPYSLEG
jgi:hypothetical protein